MLRWIAALVCFAVAAVLVATVPPFLGVLRYLPFSWVLTTWLVIALSLLALAAAWPIAGVGWWLIFRRRWFLRLLAIGPTWLLMAPWPAWYALIFWVSALDTAHWVHEPFGDDAAYVRVVCTWHSGEYYTCDADGYLRRGWSRTLTRNGTIDWTEGEGHCCSREVVHERGHVVYRVRAYSDVLELRF
ncbi:MAG: hypothetical protein KC621_31180 [Myxococcales bacterium]|nr:hypothetical protein [Myxococcales bacterium]